MKIAALANNAIKTKSDDASPERERKARARERERERDDSLFAALNRDNAVQSQQKFYIIAQQCNATQTCAFGGAVLMAGTIAGMHRLSTENHLGSCLASDTYRIVTERCNLYNGVAVQSTTLRHDEEHRRQPGYSSFHHVPS